MPVHNSVLEEVQYQVNKCLATHPDASFSCTCQRCRDDVWPWLPVGCLLDIQQPLPDGPSSGLSFQSKQAQLDILQAILAAIDRVNESPRHDPDPAVQISLPRCSVLQSVPLFSVGLPSI